LLPEAINAAVGDEGERIEIKHLTSVNGLAVYRCQVFYFYSLALISHCCIDRLR